MELHTPISRKRGFPRESSGCIEPHVVEIPPPVGRRLKRKEVLLPEIINVHMDVDSADVMVVNEKHVASKGKGPVNIKADETKEGFSTDDFGSDFYGDYTYNEDVVSGDDYALLQSYYDNLDIPTGIEAPIPWFSSPNSYEVPVSGSSSLEVSSSYNMSDAHGFSAGFHSSPSSWQPKVNKKYIPGSRSDYFSSTSGQTSSNWSSSEPQEMKTNVKTKGFAYPKHVGPGNSSSWLKPSKSFHSHSSSPENKNIYPINASSSYSSPKDLTIGAPYTPNGINEQVSSHSLWTEVGPPTYGYQYLGTEAAGSSWIPTGYSGISSASHFPSNAANFNPWLEDALVETNGVISTSSSKVVYGNPDEIMKKFQLFKKFDTVEDLCDHHYYKKHPSGGQPARGWMKKIQDEWRILEKNLPDEIYVRVCESRMDLLRAVIVGAEGTPYHDGLYFFDVFFPTTYPHSPPQVYYHSGGLHINPNLYECGKVCLSLLGTWSGSQKENWIPGLSTTLQVLVSIQGLILNEKPYFNEPGYEGQRSSLQGERSSLHYNEQTFISSMKTMIYSVKRPPKHFEDFVGGHFYNRARHILLACQAYIEGAQVGCTVKGGVQDANQGGKNCSQGFRHELARFIKTLIDAFKLVGATDLDQFLPLINKVGSIAPPLPPPPPTPHGSVNGMSYYGYCPSLY